ncbi:MAG TPA: hypothetical protein VGA73_18640 [Candidatus Binatia bacterium]
MVYVVKYRSKGSKSKIARTLFAESPAQPSREKTVEWLSNVTGGDFVEETIEIRELRDFDPIEVRSQGATVFSL